MAYSNPQNEVWFATLLDLATEVRSPQQLAYLNRCQLQAVVDDTALLTAPDAFTRDVIESRLRAPIAEALSRRLNRPVHVAVTLTRPPDAPRPAAATPRPRTDRNPPPATSPSSGGLTEAVNEFIARDKRRSDPRLRRLTYTVTGPDDNGCRATVAEHPALSHHADTPAAALFGLLDRIVGALDGQAGA